MLVRSNVVSGAGINSRTYQIQNIKADDEGQYRCRAVTLGGKVFSPVATLVVKGKSSSIYEHCCPLFPFEMGNLANSCEYTIVLY